MQKITDNIVKSWLTSLVGIASLIGGAYICWEGHYDIGCGFLTTGIGGLLSKDYDADHDRIEKLEKSNAELIKTINELNNKYSIH